MVKIIRVKVSTLERWKRWLAYARACVKDPEVRAEIQKVWADIEAERARGGES